MTVIVDLSGALDKYRARASQVMDDAFQALLVDMEADAPRDTGLMTQSIEITTSDEDTRLARTIHAPQEYSSYQDEGTGIYGPSGQPIVPVSAKVLHFVAKDGTEVFVRSVKGSPRTGWWSDKVARLGDYLQTAKG